MGMSEEAKFLWWSHYGGITKREQADIRNIEATNGIEL
jgi:hypothetical protein